MPEPLRHTGGELVEVRRSARRTRTVTARREGDRVVVMVPARTSRAEEERWVETMLARLHRSEQRQASRGSRSDDDLVARSTQLARRHLDRPAGRPVRPASVRWVAPMRSRWASCTPADGTIRVGENLRPAPAWVLDYVLVHELAHLVEPGHTARFWELVGAYPRTQRAVGYLEGLSAASRWDVATASPDDPQPDGPAAQDVD